LQTLIKNSSEYEKIKSFKVKEQFQSTIWKQFVFFLSLSFNFLPYVASEILLYTQDQSWRDLALQLRNIHYGSFTIIGAAYVRVIVAFYDISFDLVVRRKITSKKILVQPQIILETRGIVRNMNASDKNVVQKKVSFKTVNDKISLDIIPKSKRYQARSKWI
jgi:hypothetical protein